MRKFSSYGPVDPELHYYVPRQEWVDGAYQRNSPPYFLFSRHATADMTK